MHIYIYIYVHTYMYIYTFYTYMRVYVYICICTNTYTHADVHEHICEVSVYLYNVACARNGLVASHIVHLGIMRTTMFYSVVSEYYTSYDIICLHSRL